MSKSYPSRRELRLQRERAERARLRETELKRWTDEVEQREQPPVEQPKPIPASEQSDDPEDRTDEAGSAEPESPAQQISAADDTDEADETASTRARRHRRAVSPVTSTGMLPIISKPSEAPKEPKPRSRREAREQEARRAAQRQAEVARLQQAQDGTEEDSKPRRRATAPQTTPPPAPAEVEPDTTADIAQTSEVVDDDVTDVEVTATHELSATDITDMSGLDTIEIRRAELRAETERLTQEIIELGENNPNVIDPKLLRRQKELAEKSQELQTLETAAIELVESDSLEAADDVPAPESTESMAEESAAETAAESSAADTDESRLETPGQQAKTESDATPRRRSRRRTTQGPFVSGPFEVAEDEQTAKSQEQAADKSKKPPLSEFLRAPSEPEPQRDSREPLEASSAHGLDTLDARDVEAPDRVLRISAVVMFAIGVIALIIAIILLV